MGDEATKGGRSGLVWLTNGITAAAALVLSRLAEGYATNPTALVALMLAILLVSLAVAIVAVWLTGGVVHIREYRLIEDRCAKLEARLEEVTREAFIAARITGLAVTQRAEGGPP